nr:unnamed protein product [Callosobruchus chinensis]
MVNIPQIDILLKAKTAIVELQAQVATIINPEEKEAAKTNEIKKFQNRIRVLLNRNEQLANLLKDAKISIPKHLEPIKVKKYPWTGKIKPEQAENFQKKEMEIQSCEQKDENPKKSCKTKAQPSRKNSMNKAVGSKCVVVLPPSKYLSRAMRQGTTTLSNVFSKTYVKAVGGNKKCLKRKTAEQSSTVSKKAKPDANESGTVDAVSTAVSASSNCTGELEKNYVDPKADSANTKTLPEICSADEKRYCKYKEESMNPITTCTTDTPPCAISQEAKTNHSHSELSNDIFGTLTVGANCQNPESTSPTAAFLMSFPLVSSVKATEVTDEENVEGHDTENLLQTNNLDTNKIALPDNLANSLLNLDSFSFLSCSNFLNKCSAALGTENMASNIVCTSVKSPVLQAIFPIPSVEPTRNQQKI